MSPRTPAVATIQYYICNHENFIHGTPKLMIPRKFLVIRYAMSTIYEASYDYMMYLYLCVICFCNMFVVYRIANGFCLRGPNLCEFYEESQASKF